MINTIPTIKIAIAVTRFQLTCLFSLLITTPSLYSVRNISSANIIPGRKTSKKEVDTEVGENKKHPANDGYLNFFIELV